MKSSDGSGRANPKVLLKSELAAEELGKRWDRDVLVEQTAYDEHVEQVRRTGGAVFGTANSEL